MAKPVKYSTKGIIAAAFTPFKGSKAEILNLSIIPDYARYLLASGYKTVLINGTYGEGMAMTTDERIQVANAWSEAVKKTGQELIIQVGGTNLPDMRKLAAHAQSVNASAILSLPALHYKPKTVEDLIDHLADIGESAPKVPLFYYHSPANTMVDLNMAEFLKKVGNKIPSLVGIKVAHGKLDEITYMVAAAGDRFRIVVSDDLVIPPSVAIGIHIFMPTINNIAPRLVNDCYNAAMDGDFATANAYQLKIASLEGKLSAIYAKNMPLKKAIARRLLLPKIDIGMTRKPLRNYDSAPEIAQLASECAEFQ